MRKHGEKREDGKVYWGRKTNGKEEWTTHEKFLDRKLKSKQRVTKLRKARKRWLNIYKVAKGCEICGYNAHPSGLEFDHLPQYQKWKDISSIVDYSLKNLINEIRKCRVLCAICHRIFTDEQRNKKNTDGV